jgi:hypothetical protein
MRENNDKVYVTEKNINALVADERRWQIIQGHTRKKDRQRGEDFLYALVYFHLVKGQAIKALAVTQAIIDLRNPHYKELS